MQKIINWEHRLMEKGKHWGLTQERLALILKILFFLSLLPLLVVAFYNYPADDDFGFTLSAAYAWSQTHSLLAVLQAIFEHTLNIYNVWQGDFISTFQFGLNPMIFNMDLYFLTSWYQLAVLCLSVGYLLKSLLFHVLDAGKSVFWIVYVTVMILVIQYMPAISESVYWYNGGQYTITVCYLMLTLGLLMRLRDTQTPRRRIVRSVLLGLLGFALGGSFYGPALGSFVMLLLLALGGVLNRQQRRFTALIPFLFFCVSFMFSLIAPGNAIRQGFIEQTVGIAEAIYTSVTDSLDLIGQWITPQLLAALLLLIPTLWAPLMQSRFSFQHPIGFIIMLYGLFVATLTPGIYSGFGYESVRYLNAVYFHFLIMLLGSVGYLQGYFLKRYAEQHSEGAPLPLIPEDIGRRFSALYLAACLALFTVGGFADTIMNRPSVCATKVLITGEAAQFRREMDDREQYIRSTNADELSIQPLSVVIPIFKNDSLPFQGLYGRLQYMKRYYDIFQAGSSRQ